MHLDVDENCVKPRPPVTISLVSGRDNF